MTVLGILTQGNYGYGTIVMNSNGHLTINGNGDINNGDEITALLTML